MRDKGFYWIAFLGSEDRPFEPIIAWWQGDGWWVPGSAKVAGPDVAVRVLSGMLRFADRPAVADAPLSAGSRT